MNISKKTIIISSFAVLVVVIATLVVLILIKGGAPQKSTATVATISADDVIKDFNKKVNTGDLLKGSEIVETDSTSKQWVYVYDTRSEKYVSLNTSLSSIVRVPLDQREATLTTIGKFLTDKKLDDSHVLTAETPVTVYADASTSCAVSYLPGDLSPLEITVSCIDTFAKKLSEIDQLMGLWATKDSTTYDTISYNSLTKGDVTVTILKVDTKELTNPHTLVYVKKSDWKYIGDAATGTPVEDNERYVVNAEIKAGIDSKEYGAAITQALAEL